MKICCTKKVSGMFLMTLIPIVWVSNIHAQNMFRKISDFDCDGKTDFAVTRSENGLKVWYLWQSTAGFRVFQWGIGSDKEAAGDYDGDGKTDFAIFRELAAENLYVIYIFRSQTNSFTYKA